MEAACKCVIMSPKQLTAVAQEGFSDSELVLIERKHESNQNMNVSVPIYIGYIKLTGKMTVTSNRECMQLIEEFKSYHLRGIVGQQYKKKTFSFFHVLESKQQQSQYKVRMEKCEENME